MNNLPIATENNIKVILNIFEILQRYSQVKVHHALVSTTLVVKFAIGTAGGVDTGGKFAANVNNTGGK